MNSNIYTGNDHFSSELFFWYHCLFHFITIFPKKEHKLGKIFPVLSMMDLETVKHQKLLSLIIFLCTRCNFSQMLLSVHFRRTMACGKIKQRAVDVQKNHFLNTSNFLYFSISCNNFFKCNIRKISLNIINIKVLSLPQKGVRNVTYNPFRYD